MQINWLLDSKKNLIG